MYRVGLVVGHHGLLSSVGNGRVVVLLLVVVVGGGGCGVEGAGGGDNRRGGDGVDELVVLGLGVVGRGEFVVAGRQLGRVDGGRRGGAGRGGNDGV